ncbi:hypothetical protein L195_g032255 [Trifolium pratense]|uniref:Uncharacterized protein n=1 Tax=Trifolium pratense TaxID=57577 RepID=A0A2K3LCQ6_TRIPR|nr:hypothetical protein L195_g032255 [Trifolium pratense]
MAQLSKNWELKTPVELRMAQIRIIWVEFLPGFCAEKLRMAQSKLVKEDLIPVSCAMAQRSCAWRKMNLWEMDLDLEAAPRRKRPAPLRSCNCLFAKGFAHGAVEDQEDDARIKQDVDDVQEDHGTLSIKVQSFR